MMRINHSAGNDTNRQTSFQNIIKKRRLHAGFASRRWLGLASPCLPARVT